MGGTMQVKWRAVVAAAAVAVVAPAGAACGAGKGPLKITTTVEKTCVRPGDQQTILTKAVPNAKVAYAVGYSDGYPHGTGAPAGSVDTKGVFHGTWNIPADAPPGAVNVTVLAAVDTRTTKKPTTFKVAKADGTCS